MFRTPVLDIYVTGTCNLACPYCFGELDTRPGMARKTFQEALRFAHFVGAATIELCGGEPLLYRDLEWAVERAQAEGFGLILRTNGLLTHKKREFIAANFQAVGISLDGDPEANHLMRPSKGRNGPNPIDKFEIPLREISALKALSPKIRILLATVATAENLPGVYRLAEILLVRRLPIDLWKIHQFVSNNFRARDTKERFSVPAEAFTALESSLQERVGGVVPFSCRRAEDVDGSCLIVNREGDVVIGASVFGNLTRDAFGGIVERLDAGRMGAAIRNNKTATYAAALSEEARR